MGINMNQSASRLASISSCVVALFLFRLEERKKFPCEKCDKVFITKGTC